MKGTTTMLRYAFALTITLGTAAGLAAAVEGSAAKSQQLSAAAARVTVVEKNNAFPVLGPIVMEDCAVEDCSDVQS
jgi:hypothetical protein